MDQEAFLLLIASIAAFVIFIRMLISNSNYDKIEKLSREVKHTEKTLTEQIQAANQKIEKLEGKVEGLTRFSNELDKKISILSNDVSLIKKFGAPLKNDKSESSDSNIRKNKGSFDWWREQD